MNRRFLAIVFVLLAACAKKEVQQRTKTAPPPLPSDVQAVATAVTNTESNPPQASSSSVPVATESGGAIIETTQGQVDAQLETKLAQLGNALWTFVMDVSATESVEE